MRNSLQTFVFLKFFDNFSLIVELKMAARYSSDPDIKLSKTLSWILRHGATKVGLTLDSEGFIPVQTLLSLPEFRNCTLADIQRVVSTNSKQRFALKNDPKTSQLLIRANQGHSLQVDNLDIQEITNPSDIPIVVHGTFKKNLQAIKKSGLSRMNRQHVHFASGLPGENDVISGMRKTCDVFVYVNMELALTDGIKFFLSSNGVILTPGNEEGFLLPKYFQKIEIRRH